MPTAVKPLTLFNNTIADANDVMSLFNVLYTTINGLDHENMDLTSDFDWTGEHSFEAAKLKVKGAGAGIASLQNANTATSRTITIPDAGADDVLMSTKAAKVAGAGTGVATLQNANTTNSRTYTIPDPGANDNLVTDNSTSTLANKSLISPNLTTPKIIGAGAGVATLQNANTANNRTITIPDVGVSANLTYSGDYFSSSINTTSIGNSSDINYSTVASFSFTITIPGKYFIGVKFKSEVQTSSSNGYSSNTAFRMIDTNPLDSTDHTVSGTTAGINSNFVLDKECFLFSFVNFSTTGGKGISLQKYNTVSTNISSRTIYGQFLAFRVAN